LCCADAALTPLKGVQQVLGSVVDELERTRCEPSQSYSTASRNSPAASFKEKSDDEGRSKEDCTAQRVGEEVLEGKEQIVAAWGRDREERHDQNQARLVQHQNQDDESPGDQSLIHSSKCLCRFRLFTLNEKILPASSRGAKQSK